MASCNGWGAEYKTTGLWAERDLFNCPASTGKYKFYLHEIWLVQELNEDDFDRCEIQ